MTRIKQGLQSYVHSANGKALLGAAIASVVLLSVWWYAARWYEARLLSEERAEAGAETSLRGNTLSLTINRRLARLQGLYAFAEVESTADDLDVRFSTFAERLYAGAQGIRYLAIAPDGVLQYIYPLEGNERVISYDMLHDPRPQVRADTERAIESGHAVATGPVELVEGGLGLIARQPVYQGNHFWGLVSIVLDVPTLLDELTGGMGDLEFALLDSEGELFFGPPAILDDDPVFVLVPLSEETWELAAVPAAGWGATTRGALWIFQIAGIIIVALLTGLTYLSVNRQARLTEAVERRTGEISSINEQLQQDIVERRRAEAALAEREEQYRSIFESTSDGLLIFDLQGHLVDYNPAACRMHGYSEAEMGTLTPAHLIHSDSMAIFDRFLDTVQAGKEFHGRAVSVHQRGSVFHIEVDGTGFVYRGQPHALAVVRDITEEVEAFHLLEVRVEERTRELATLLQTSASIASTLELQPLLGLVLEQLGKIVDYSGASILILEEEGLRDAAHQGIATGRLFREVRGGRVWELMQKNELIIVDDLQGDGELAQAWSQAGAPDPDPEWSQARALIAVPFTIEEQVCGWLLLYHGSPGAYTTHHAALAQTVANQAATAVENAYLFDRTRHLAALEERQRLARELHDSVSQVLYSIGLAGHTALTLLKRDPDRAAEPMKYLLSLAEAGLAEMRALIFELRPESLEKDGLVVALSRQAAALRARHDLEVHTDLGEEPMIGVEIKEALYRIAQEALNNVAKHAQASQVAIRLYEVDNRVALDVIDDGIGFDPEREYPGQMGLVSMRERAATVEGTLELESASREGTRVRVRIPIGQ